MPSADRGTRASCTSRTSDSRCNELDPAHSFDLFTTRRNRVLDHHVLRLCASQVQARYDKVADRSSPQAVRLTTSRTLPTQQLATANTRALDSAPMIPVRRRCPSLV